MKKLARMLVLLVCGAAWGLPLAVDASVSNRTCTVDGLYVFTPENLRNLGLRLSDAQQGRIGALAVRADRELSRRGALRVKALEKDILGVLSPPQRGQLTEALIKAWDAGIVGDLGVALDDRQKARVLRSVATFVQSTEQRGMVYPEAVRALRQGTLSALTPRQREQYERKKHSLPPELASIVPFLEKTGSFTLSDAQKESIRRYMGAETEEMRLIGASEGGIILRETRHDVCLVLTPDQRKRLTDARTRQYYEILRPQKPAGMSMQDVMQAARRQAEAHTCGSS
jgi:hypothetical protein